MVRACTLCNLTKGACDPYQWYRGSETEPIPRIVLGKFLKIVLEAHAACGVLDLAAFMKLHSIERITLSSIFLRKV
jgi:hypothetical protein